MERDPLIDVFCEEAGELLAGYETGVLRLESAPQDRDGLAGIFRVAHTLKGNARMLGFEAMARFTHRLEDLLDGLRKGVLEATPEIVEALLASGDTMRRMLAEAVDGTPSATPADQRLEERLAALAAPAGAERDTPSRAEPGTPPPAEGGTPPPAEGAAPSEARSLRVPTHKVDRLIDQVGELVIAQAILTRTLAAGTRDDLTALREAVQQLERHTRALHAQALAIRTLPLRSFFGRFPRLVRDLALRTGKEVALEVRGDETGLDVTLIDRLHDPLIHLVRNCVDHGLETPEERRAAGKPATGRVRLDAYQRGGWILIEVADDGRGLDRERIRVKAVERGWLAADRQAGDDELFAFLFRPGFSTAEQVTEVSGRGVGMDVVRSHLEAIGGAIEIHSEPGRGTRFRIQVPLTLALLEAQLLRVEDRIFALPLIAVRESVRPAAAAFHTLPGGAELVQVREHSLPLVRAGTFLGVPGRDPAPGLALVVLVEQKGQAVALLVDELLDVQPVVIKSVEQNYGRVEGIGGATVLGDGQVALILDVAALVASAGRGRGRQAA